MQYKIHRIFDKCSNVLTLISILLYLITEHVNLNFRSFRILYSVLGRFSSLQNIFFIFYNKYMKLNCSAVFDNHKLQSLQRVTTEGLQKPLFSACEKLSCGLDVVRELVQHGADVNMTGDQGSPLLVAARQ